MPNSEKPQSPWPNLDDSAFPLDLLFSPAGYDESVTLERLAAFLLGLAEDLEIELEQNEPLPEAQASMEEDLRGLYSEVKRLADLRKVRLSWLPLPELADSGSERLMKLLGAVIEGLEYLKRQPEFARSVEGAA